MDFLVAQMVKNPSAMQETQVWSQAQEDPLEKRMATLASITWRTPWTEEPGDLQFSSVTQSCPACSNSSPSSHWYHPTISSSFVLFSFWLQSFPASGSFPMSQFFASGGQSIGASASASVLPMNSQGWFPFGLAGLISSLSKGLSRVFSNTRWATVHV